MDAKIAEGTYPSHDVAMAAERSTGQVLVHSRRLRIWRLHFQLDRDA